MMNLTVMLFTVVLFVLLTPGIVTRLPPCGLQAYGCDCPRPDLCPGLSFYSQDGLPLLNGL